MGPVPNSPLEDFTRRTGLSEKALKALAQAGALSSLEPDRRSALWKVVGLAATGQPSLALEDTEAAPSFDMLSDFETIAWDHRTSSHSVRGYPLEPLRAELAARGLPTARELSNMRHGDRVRYAGIVICRQRPGTARGVVFMTLEDETGFVNAILWQSIVEKFGVLAKSAVFLGVSGKLQREDGVVHLVVEKLWEPRLSVQPPEARSRDFR